MSRKAVRKSKRAGHAVCDIQECDETRALVEHHIEGRDIRNFNAAWNRCWICPNCHDDVHAGDLIIEVWRSTTSGRLLFSHRRDEGPVVSPGTKPPLYTGAQA